MDDMHNDKDFECFKCGYKTKDKSNLNRHLKKRKKDCTSTEKLKPTTFEQSFASHPKAKHWHLTKNDKTPEHVFKATRDRFWFTCETCFHDFEIHLYHVSSPKAPRWCPYCSKHNSKFCDDDDCQFCFNKSFASCEKSNYWHPTKNGDLKPRNVSRMNDMKIWFRCNKCPHDFEGTVSHISKGAWCPYCSNTKRCSDSYCQMCFEKSFASNPNSIYWHSIKNGSITPRDVAKKTDETFWFSCDKCVHDFQHILSNDTWCPYCRGSKLCDDDDCQFCFNKSFASCEKSNYWHPTKNGDLKPRTICKSANVKAWFNCDRCLNPFIIWIPNIQERNGWCNICKHKTEHKLHESLIRYFPDIQMQFKAEWCKSSVTNYYYRFDFCIEEQRTIIELDGRQHFKDVAYFRSSFEEVHFVDMIKQSAANNNGYKVIRILQEDVWSDKYDWLTELLKNIEDDTMPNIFMCKNEEYSIFQIDQNQDKQLFECDRRIDGYLGLTEFEDPNPNPPQKLKLTYDESDVIEQCVI
jgi:very-short-patch-repair endonuclease